MWCLFISSSYISCDYVFVLYFVFFFKQKTAYEMRISDWSSDVCSSDLLIAILKLCAEGNDPSIHLRADRLIAQIGVDCISEVNGRRSLRSLLQLALWREREDAILIHRHMRMFEQFVRALDLFQNFNEVAYPPRLSLRTAAPLFLYPVRPQPQYP